MAETKLFCHVPHKPSDMVDFVSNVEGYPEFINLLSAVRVSERKELGDGHENFEAEATVSYKFVSEQFRSLVDVFHSENRINVSKSGTKGAVKALENNWIFHELSDGSTLVEFYVQVKLKAFPLEVLLRDKFDKAANHIMNVFTLRAGQLYEHVGDDNINLEAEYARLGLKQEMAELS